MLQVLFQRTVINAYLFGDDIYKTGKDCRVNQVHEERADHRHNQEGFVRRTEGLRDGLHIGNGGRRCAQAEAAVSCRQNCCIVVAPHKNVGGECRVQNHHDGLYGENDGYRTRQTGQFPQFQVQKRHCKEKRQGGIAEYVDGAVEHIDFKRRSQNVADDDTGKQTPYEFRQVIQIFFVEAVHNFGKCQTRCKHGKRFDGGFGGNQAGALRLFEHVVGMFV